MKTISRCIKNSSTTNPPPPKRNARIKSSAKSLRTIRRRIGISIRGGVWVKPWYVIRRRPGLITALSVFLFICHSRERRNPSTKTDSIEILNIKNKTLNVFYLWEGTDHFHNYFCFGFFHLSHE